MLTCEPRLLQLGTKTMAICSPIDQCQEGNGGCEDSCRSHAGKSICSCGYVKPGKG